MMIQKILNNDVVLIHVRIEKYFYSKKKFIFLISLADFPQKRVDRQRSNGTNIGQTPNSGAYRTGIIGQLTEGSPLVPRRQLYSNLR